MGRKPCCDKEKVKRGHWTKEEDLRLKAFIDRHGTSGEWMSLPKRAGLQRCGKSCRMRWLNYLRPGIRHGDFSEYEDNLICNLYAILGSRWSVIASHLPGRTDNDLKNYWNTRLRFKWIQRKKTRVASAIKTYTLPNVNENCEYSSVSVESSYSGSTSSSTGISHIPSSDMDIFGDINWPPEFWPNEDDFETAALLRTFCNMNMNEPPAQEDPITNNNLMAESLLYCDTSNSPFDFTFRFRPSNSEVRVSVDAFLFDDQSLIVVNEPLNIQQQKGESKESSGATTEDNCFVQRAENGFPGTG